MERIDTKISDVIESDYNSGESRISKTGGGQPSVWGKNLLFGKIFAENWPKTRMHSSMMRTVRSSSRLPRWGVSSKREGVCLGGVCSEGCIPACTEADTPRPVDRILDTRL